MASIPPRDEFIYKTPKKSSTPSTSSSISTPSKSPLILLRASTPSKSPSVLLHPSTPSKSPSVLLDPSTPSSSPSLSFSPSTPLRSPALLFSPLTPLGSYPFSSPSTPLNSSSSHVNGDYEYHEEIISSPNSVTPLVVSKVRTITFNISLPENKFGIGYGMSPLRLPTPTSPELESESEVEPPETPGRESNVEGSYYAVSCRKGKGKTMQDTHKVVSMTINVLHPADDGDSKQEFEADAEDVSFFGVFDGHGGRKAADFAAENIGKNIVNALLKALEDKLQLDEDTDIEKSDNLQLDDIDIINKKIEKLQLDEDTGIDIINKNNLLNQKKLEQAGIAIINKNNLLNQKNLEQAVRAGYLRTDEEFLEQGVSSGTTCVTALIIGGKLVVSNAGDSRAVISRRSKDGNGGEAQALTRDHKAGREDEQERIEKLGGLVLKCGGYPRIGRLIVSRGIGDSDYKEWITPEPDTTILEITSDDEFLILATDGLWDVVSNQEAVEIARPFCIDMEHGGGPLAACEKLVEVAVARRSLDDITAMIIQLQHFS